MRYPVASRCHAALVIFMGVVLLLAPSCDHPTERPPMAKEHPTPQFRRVSYQLARLDEPTFRDSLRALPRADSTFIKRLLVPGQHDAAFDSATAYRRYRTFALGPYRAEVVAVVSDFNTVSGSMQLLLFTAGNQWVSTVALASHADEAGAMEELTSVQVSPVAFEQHKVTSEMVETHREQEGKPEELLGVATTTTRVALRLDRGRLTKTRLDSTYQLVKERQAGGYHKRPE
jgi:hypothetical protein